MLFDSLKAERSSGPGREGREIGVPLSTVRPGAPKTGHEGSREEVGGCRVPENMGTTEAEEGGKHLGIGKHELISGNKGTAGPPQDRDRLQTEL